MIKRHYNRYSCKYCKTGTNKTDCVCGQCEKKLILVRKLLKMVRQADTKH